MLKWKDGNFIQRIGDSLASGSTMAPQRVRSFLSQHELSHIPSHLCRRPLPPHSSSLIVLLALFNKRVIDCTCTECSDKCTLWSLYCFSSITPRRLWPRSIAIAERPQRPLASAGWLARDVASFDNASWITWRIYQENWLGDNWLLTCIPLPVAQTQLRNRKVSARRPNVVKIATCGNATARRASPSRTARWKAVNGGFGSV